MTGLRYRPSPRSGSHGAAGRDAGDWPSAPTDSKTVARRPARARARGRLGTAWQVVIPFASGKQPDMAERAGALLILGSKVAIPVDTLAAMTRKITLVTGLVLGLAACS